MAEAAMAASDMIGVQGPCSALHPQLNLPTQDDAQLSNKRGLAGKPVSCPAPSFPPLGILLCTRVVPILPPTTSDIKHMPLGPTPLPHRQSSGRSDST